MSPQNVCMLGCIFTLVAFFRLFPTMCFQMCPQIACLRLCLFIYVSFIHLDQIMHSHTGCICLTFLHCAFPNVYSKSLDQRRQSHTGCIFFSYSPPCIFKSLLKSPAWKKAYSHRLHLFGILHCVFSNVCSKCLNKMIQSCIVCICWTFSSVCVQMSPQIACLKEGLFTSVAFIWHPPLCVFKCLFKVFE